jgi:electron transfer flavoprotein alpha subunit
MDLPHYNHVEQFERLQQSGDDLTWAISSTNDSTSSVDHTGRGVFCFDQQDSEDDYTIQDTIRGWESNIEQKTVSTDMRSFDVTFHKRKRTGESTNETVANDPASAATAFLDHIDQGDSADEPTEGTRINLEAVTQPVSSREESPIGLFVAPPATKDTDAGPVIEALSKAHYLCSRQDLSLGVILPTNGDEHVLHNTINRLSDTSVSDILLYEDPDVTSFSWADYVYLLNDINERIEPAPELWMGPGAYNDVLCRLQGDMSGKDGRTESQGPVSWFNTDMLSIKNGTVDASTSVMDNQVHATAHLPREHPQIITFQDDVRIPDHPDHHREEQPGSRSDTNIYRLDVLPDTGGSPALSPLFRTTEEQGDVDELDEARIIIDVGYGVGDAEGMKSVVDPFRQLLEDELDLNGVMVGATRKVTQDLELLPDDRQIGQTGTRVQPNLLFALGVSGAPQHIDYIGENTTIFSFNIDEDAPLMTLNNERPAPFVHPIHGDLFETVPAFIEEVKSLL